MRWNYISCQSKKRKDIWMGQTFPEQSFMNNILCLKLYFEPMELCLLGLYLLPLLSFLIGAQDSQDLDGNWLSAMGSSIDVGKPPS
jgi:hypothetical protein